MGMEDISQGEVDKQECMGRNGRQDGTNVSDIQYPHRKCHNETIVFMKI